jgi:hypothetical protein
MKFAYQNSGGPMSWKNGPPMQTRGGDAAALGSLGDHSLALTLPVPGGPEPINGFSDYIAVGDSGDGIGDCGCGCKGAGTCGGTAMGATDTTTTVIRVGSAAAAYIAYKEGKKSKGGKKTVLYLVAAAAAYEAIFGG